MTNSKYFKNITCVEDLKEQFHKLIKQYHPDVNQEDTTKIMQEINAEFSELHKKFKNKHRSKDGEGTYETTNCTETPEEFIEILSKLVHLEGLEIELCGRWLWISGNTYNHKDALKAAGCKFASKKKMWYWHPVGDECRGSSKTTMEYIRTRYGSQKIDTAPLTALA